MATIGTLSGAEIISQSCFQSIVKRRGLFPRLLHFGVEDHLRWSGNSAVLSNAPEMHDHENRSDDGNADAMPNVGAQQRIRVNNRAAQQSKPDVVVWSHTQLRA